MIDKEIGIFFVKIIAGIIALILLFTVIIPKWQEIDNAFNEKIRSFVGLIFDTSSSFKKSASKEENDYLASGFNETKNFFIKKFLNIKTPDEINKTISLGKDIVLMAPDKVEIIRDIAFLYYIKKDYVNALANYQIVLKNYSKRKRVFNKLKGADSRSVKRALADIAAVYYAQGEMDKMLDYYKQYLRASQRDDVYRDLLNQGVDEKTARYGIFTAMAGDGYLSYEKAIEELGKLGKEYPSDDEIFYQLGLYNFDVVNLFGQDDFKSIENNYYDAKIYFYKVLNKSDEFRQQTININLAKLEKIKAKYEEQALSSIKK
ncbi:MAG: tetratricopeptide repeat protein [Candidatus Omnitrophica bacterium]|nr:tetratricopeptide repeat protein [Candidatus Omnitrophota bacterium]